MDRRQFLRAITTGSLAATLPGLIHCDLHFGRKTHPNFVIFLADDLGFGDLACYGNPINKTPHLDQFAQEGVRFTDCHSGGTVCSPSRASLLTGRNPYRSGLYYIVGSGAHLMKDEITIASLLQQNGYDTCFVGKWHLSRIGRQNIHQPTPGDHGFDHWFATELNAFEGPENPTEFLRNGEKLGKLKGWYCDIIVKEALDWLNRRDSVKPFFLLVSSHEPHTPVEPPDKYAQMYASAEVDSLERSIDYGDVERPDKDIKTNKKYYYGTVTQLDQAFGNLMKGLDKMGLREETLVLFTSDNGPEHPVNLEESRGEWEDPIRDRCFGTPGILRGMKRYPFEGGHKVPGIARWPGYIKPGSTCDTLFNGTDILPTLCELASIPVPKDRTIDGISVAPLFRNRSMDRDDPVCWLFPAHEDTHYRMPHMAMRQGGHVLIAWFNPKEKEQLIMDWIKSARLEAFELYDLHSDPEQQKDISTENPNMLNRMIPVMKEMWADIQAEGPVWPDWKMK